jgi:hypothetical protein
MEFVKIIRILLCQREGYDVYACKSIPQFLILNPTVRPSLISVCSEDYLWNYMGKVEMSKTEKNNSERYHDSDCLICANC